MPSSPVWVQERTSRGIHELPKVSLWLTMLYHSTPCGWPPFKWPFGRFRGCRSQWRKSMAVLLPSWILHAIRPSVGTASVALDANI
jgi:hypothetical protein